LNPVLLKWIFVTWDAAAGVGTAVVTFAITAMVVATVAGAVVTSIAGGMVVSAMVGGTVVATVVGTGVAAVVVAFAAGVYCVQPQIATNAIIRAINPSKIFIQIYM
jgi:negative regulator of sigma E activity